MVAGRSSYMNQTNICKAAVQGRWNTPRPPPPHLPSLEEVREGLPDGLRTIFRKSFNPLYVQLVFRSLLRLTGFQCNVRTAFGRSKAKWLLHEFVTAYELEDHLQSRESHDIKAEINKDTFYFITIVFF